MTVPAELPHGGQLPNGQVYGADSLMAWVSRNWFGVVGRFHGQAVLQRRVLA
jgi:hypothetical protein